MSDLFTIHTSGMAGIYPYQGRHAQVITADVWSIRQAYIFISVSIYGYYSRCMAYQASIYLYRGKYIWLSR